MRGVVAQHESTGNDAQDEREFSLLFALAALGPTPVLLEKKSRWQLLRDVAEKVLLILLALLLLPVTVAFAPFAYLLRKPFPWLASACASC